MIRIDIEVRGVSNQDAPCLAPLSRHFLSQRSSHPGAGELREEGGCGSQAGLTRGPMRGRGGPVSLSPTKGQCEKINFNLDQDSLH